MFEDCEKKPTNCCAAAGWTELGRERVDMTERPTLNRIDNKRGSNRIPDSTWKRYNWVQHYNDVMGREFVRCTVI